MILRTRTRTRTGQRLALAACGWLLVPTPCLPTDPPVLSSPRRAGGQFEFTLLGQSNRAYRIETTANFQAWIPVATNTEPGATRLIALAAPAARAHYRATRLGTPYFRFALAAAESVDLNGQNLNADSFNSADPLRSTGGLYDPAKAGDHGDVAAVRGLINPPAVGNAIVAGTLRMNAGGATAIGPQGAVGDRTWILAGNHGIQPGHLETNLVLALPTPLPPTPVGFVPTGGFVDGTFYSYVLDTGDYALVALGLSSSQKLYVRGQAMLQVSGGVTIAGSGSLVVGTNASLRLYVGGANASLSMAAVSGVRRAGQFQIYGMAGNSSVNLLGGPTFTGAVFAPSATVTLGTPGAGTPQLSGAFVARFIRLNSGASVHFDEDLAVTGPAY